MKQKRSQNAFVLIVLKLRICLKMGKVRSDLGIQIRQARMSKRITQSKLAELVGCNQEYISF